MIDFTPLFRALLEALVSGTAIYLLMAGRKGTSAWVWGAACVVGVGVFELLMYQSGAWPSYSSERGSFPAVAAPMAGALCSVAIAMSDRTKALPRWLGIGSSVVGFYGARLLLRLALSFLP